LSPLAYDGSRKEIIGSQNISSSPKERKLFSGDDILQIKKEESVRHTTKRTKGMHNIDAHGQLTHSQTTFSNVS
jgi:hypothetical protein